MAALIDYPSTLPCHNLAGQSSDPASVAYISEFDIGIRKRKRYCGTYQISYTFVMKSKAQMQEWRDFFYNTLNNGVKTFNADFEVEGNIGFKEFRFFDGYEPVALGTGKFRVTATFDMLTSIKDL